MKFLLNMIMELIFHPQMLPFILLNWINKEHFKGLEQVDFHISI
jgi:hypothetical protein